MPLRLVLADDAALIRQALAELLQRAGLDVVAQAGNAPSLLRAVEDHQPDIAIVDIRMPPTQTTEGIRAALQIRERVPATGILLLSTHTEIDDAVELFSATASSVGYLLKDSVSDLDELTGALTRISEGGTVLDPKLVVELLGRARRADPLDVLTPREREVVGLMAEGQSNTGIAQTLWITHGTSSTSSASSESPPPSTPTGASSPSSPSSKPASPTGGRPRNPQPAGPELLARSPASTLTECRFCPAGRPEVHWGAWVRSTDPPGQGPGGRQAQRQALPGPAGTGLPTPGTTGQPAL